MIMYAVILEITSTRIPKQSFVVDLFLSEAEAERCMKEETVSSKTHDICYNLLTELYGECEEAGAMYAFFSTPVFANGRDLTVLKSNQQFVLNKALNLYVMDGYVASVKDAHSMGSVHFCITIKHEVGGFQIHEWSEGCTFRTWSKASDHIYEKGLRCEYDSVEVEEICSEGDEDESESRFYIDVPKQLSANYLIYSPNKNKALRFDSYHQAMEFVKSHKLDLRFFPNLQIDLINEVGDKKFSLINNQFLEDADIK